MIKPIPEWTGYYASDDGFIFSDKSGQLCRLKTREAKGYLHLNLSRAKYDRRDNACVHTLVLEAFVGKRPAGMQARHYDGDKSNNSVGNLFWGTSKENHADRKRHGTDAVGVRNGRSKLTEKEVGVIRRLLAIKTSKVRIAKIFGVSDPLIGFIDRRVEWKHIA